jgi:predicted amidohydrolase
MGEFDTGWERPSEALAAAREIVARAAAAGARLVALPEMSTTGFTMSSERFAESVEGPSVNALRDMAAAQGVWIAAGVATREQLSGDATPKGYNSLLVIAPDGEIDAHYRKQRLFACGGEHAAYSPGALRAVLSLMTATVPITCPLLSITGEDEICTGICDPSLRRCRASPTQR